jgi:predicted DNA-binding transcriptional regulator YafY
MMPDLDGWARSGTLSTGTSAKIWISPDRAPRAREEYEPSLELKDGAILIDLPYGGVNWLVSEIFKFGADAVVLEPADAREAVRDAAKALSTEIDGGGVKAAAARPRPSGDARKKPVAAG